MVEAKSPNPSIERIAACSNGDAKKALATWALWCSTWWSAAATSAPRAASSSALTSRNRAAVARRSRRERLRAAPGAGGGEPLAQEARARPVRQGAPQLRAEVRLGVAADRDVI